MTKIFHNFQAYDVAEGKINPRTGAVMLKAGDEIALVSAPMQHYQMGSVVSSALRYNECPMKAVERARGFGHALHFAFALGTCLHSGPIVKGRYIGVELGQRIEFEGRTFEIAAAPNRNIKLVEIENPLVTDGGEFPVAVEA